MKKIICIVFIFLISFSCKKKEPANTLPITTNTPLTEDIILLNFNFVSGGHPSNNSLISDGTFLYGAVSFGGIGDYGLIFKIKPDGSAYTDLLDVYNQRGENPKCGLYYDGAYLYGSTMSGGQDSMSNAGTIFKIKLDGTGYVDLFNLGTVQEETPIGTLISDGTYLYGVTYDGGLQGQGSVFKIKPDGTGFSTIHSSFGPTGQHPVGPLLYDGTYLYGSASRCIFKIKPDGSGFTTFNYQCQYGLITDGTFLYGTAYGDNVNDNGHIFKIKPDGTDYTDLFSFNITNGKNPDGPLTSDGTYLYGTTYYGGAKGQGVVFKIKPDGTNFSVVLNFNGTNGAYPQGCSLLCDSTYLYGMTSSGGLNHAGVIFKVKKN